jgi:hypothetical protein
MKIKKLLLRILLIFVILFSLLVITAVGFIGYLKIFKGQKVVAEYTINENKAGVNKILIVTQKSDYKDRVMKKIQDFFKDKDVFIKVVDATKVDISNINEFSGIIIFSTIEGGKIPEKADIFIKNLKDYKNAYILSTANSGKWNCPYKYDSYTSASKIKDVDFDSEKMIEKIKAFTDILN